MKMFADDTKVWCRIKTLRLQQRTPR